VPQYSEKHKGMKAASSCKSQINPSSATVLESIHLYFSKTARSKNACKQRRETIGQEIRVPKNNSVIDLK